jgi:hypothetical protein
MSSLIRRIERQIDRKNGVKRKCPKKGTYGRRIIKRVVGPVWTHELHATKGWRTYATVA